MKQSKPGKPERKPIPKRTTPLGEDISDTTLQRKRAQLVTLPFQPQTENARGKLLVDLAGLYWRRGEYSPSVDVWQQLLKMAEAGGDPEFLAKVHSTLSATYAHSGDSTTAITHAKRALVYDPHSMEAMFALGLAYDHAGDYPNAIRWWQRLLLSHPELQHVYDSLGSIYARQGDYGEAERFLQKALAMDPTEDTTLNELGNLYVTLGRYQEAQDLFKKAMRLDPKRASASNNLGNCYLRMGRIEDARRAYEQRVQMRPEDALWANIGLGIIYRSFPSEKALAKSKAYFEQALDIYAGQQARLLTGRLIEHEVRRALTLTGLDDREGWALWSALMNNPDIHHVGPGPWDDWLFCLRLLARGHKPPAHIQEIIELVEQRHTRDQSDSDNTTAPE